MTHELIKAGMMKRISALVLDLILLSIVAVGFIYLIGTVAGYDSANARLAERYDYFEKTYNVRLSITNEEYRDLPEEEKAHYDEVAEIIAKDEEAAVAYKRVVNITMLMTSLGIFLAFLALEFFVPFFLNNGQTVGKKVFNICVVGPDAVRIGTLPLFVRSILGKYVLETMVPIFIIFLIIFNGIGMLGLILLGAILLLQVIALFASGRNAAIHDLLASTTVVDGATQKIFDTRKDAEAYFREAAEYRERHRDY